MQEEVGDALNWELYHTTVFIFPIRQGIEKYMFRIIRVKYSENMMSSDTLTTGLSILNLTLPYNHLIQLSIFPVVRK